MTTPSRIIASSGTSIAQYYVKINELSPVANVPNSKTTITTTESSPDYSPWTSQLLSAPFLISGILFILALGILTAGKFRLTRIGISGFLIAIFAAAIPTALTLIHRGNDTVVNASPTETPRNVRIMHRDNSSVRVTWETQKSQPGLIRYSYTQTGKIHTQMAGSIHTRTISHEVVLTDLLPNIQYSIEILSGDHWYTNGADPIQFIFHKNGP